MRSNTPRSTGKLTVPEHVVLGGARGTLQPRVGHEVEVPLHGVADAGLDHGTREHVTRLVLVFPEKKKKWFKTHAIL